MTNIYINRVPFALFLIAIFSGMNSAEAQRRHYHGHGHGNNSVVGESIKGAAIGAIINGAFGGNKAEREKAAKVGAALGALGAISRNERARKEQERARQAYAARLQAERIAAYRRAQAQEEYDRQRRIADQQRLAQQRAAQLQQQQILQAAQLRQQEEQYKQQRQRQQEELARAQQQTALLQVNLIKSIQRSLTVIGTSRLSISGVVDADTRAAIIKYQKSMGLPANGTASQSLLNHLWANGG